MTSRTKLPPLYPSRPPHYIYFSEISPQKPDFLEVWLRAGFFQYFFQFYRIFSVQARFLGYFCQFYWIYFSAQKYELENKYKQTVHIKSGICRRLKPVCGPKSIIQPIGTKNSATRSEFSSSQKGNLSHFSQCRKLDTVAWVRSFAWQILCTQMRFYMEKFLPASDSLWEGRG